MDIGSITIVLVVGGYVIIMLGMVIDFSRLLKSGGATGNVTVVISHNVMSYEKSF